MTEQFRGYALVVTVEQNMDHSLPDLGNNVHADGDLIERVLLDQDVCGYVSERVIRLAGMDATAKNIYAVLDSLRRTVKASDPIFFYFSGHGDANSCDGSTGASLFPWDAEVGRCINVLTSRMFGRAWHAIPSKRKFAVVDACYSGGLRMTKSGDAAAKHLSRPQLRSLSDGEGSVLISSSRASETSLILGRDSNSLFTKHLANGLLGQGGHDRDGFVRVFDLFNYVAINVRHEAPDQSPVYAAYHQDKNFAVAYCLNPSHRKAEKSVIESVIDNNAQQTITTLFSLLYPLGPTDQAIWERAGGDLSRLRLSGQGRTDWYRAIQLIDRGGSVTFDMICREALLDFPKNRDLERLRQFLGARRHSRCTPGSVDTQCAPVGAEGGIYAKKEGKVDRT